MIEEYIFAGEGKLSREAFLDYLKVKLEIEGYWEMVGLA